MKNSKLYCCYSVPLRDFIAEHGITYEICAKNPNTNNLMWIYINEIKELKLIIEVNGPQHYKVCLLSKESGLELGKTPEEVLEYQKWKDKYKKQYALDQGYHYLEIPYNIFRRKDGLYRKMIDDKISEIAS